MTPVTMTKAGSATQTYHDDLHLVRDEIDKCMKCGNCMAVCPVYSVDKDEMAVTRSKIAVADAVLKGDLSLVDPEVSEMIFNCLVCKSCMTNCPTKVGYDKIVLAFRAALVRKNGLPWLKKMIFSTLKNPRMFDAAMKFGASVQGVAFKGDRKLKAISPRSPFALVGSGIGFDADRKMPALAVTPLRERVEEVVTPPKVKLKVAFFTGDSLNYFYPDAGMDLVEVLTANDIEVHIPKEQSCCGIPVLVHGDTETVRSLARNNIDQMVATGCEYLVTGCGSCGGAWQHDYVDLFAADPVYKAKAEYWAKRTYDISTFLTKVVRFRQPKGQVDAVVTYHDSCHLKKTMKVFAEPREILKSIPGVTLKEMAAPDTCCGSGGSYVVSHYDTSSCLGRNKAQDINQTGADTVSVGCPACMMQLLDNVSRFGKEQKVSHYISLLADSYRKEKEIAH